MPVVLVGAYVIGASTRSRQSGQALRVVLAPGPNSNRHSLASTACAQCHREAHNVEDVRCERCHDASVSARLSNGAHVFQGTGDLGRALQAPVVQCATCHLEHRGGDVRLADVDDRECGSCHRAERDAGTRLTSFTRHPEFALVRAGAETGSGLRWFDHSKHVPKVRTKFQKTCDACHVRSPDAAAFLPISFPLHCASCHEADLSDSAGTIAASSVAALGPLPLPLQTQPDPDDPGRQTITGLKHADPWILSTVQALRRTLNSGLVDADRLMLERQIAQLELIDAYGGPAAGSGAWTGLLETARPAGAGAARPRDQGLRESAAAIESLLSALTPPDTAAAALLREAGRLKSNPGLGDPPIEAPSGVDVGPLRQLLAATIARAQTAGNKDIVDRARALGVRLDGQARNGHPPASSAGAAQGLLQDLRAADDPRVRAEVSRLRYLAQIAERQTAGGLDPTAFDRYRQQMLRLLEEAQQGLLARSTAGPDALEADQLLARITALRRRILGIDYGVPAGLARDRVQFFRSRYIERARLDTELEPGLRTPPASEPDGPRPEAGRLARLRLALAAVGTAPRLAGSMAPDETRRVIAALIGVEVQDAEANARQKNRCTLCHELGAGGDRLAPVWGAGESLLTNATFSHKPHVSGDNCEACHSSIRTSTAARDVNLPGVASCVACHAPGKEAAAATGCESCHKYHARARTALVWTP